MATRITERTRHEVEAKLKTMGDYVKMDYLQRALTSGVDFDTRKFVLVELSRLYDLKGMHLEAGKLMKNAAEINTTFKSKIQDFMKSVELYVKGGNYLEADSIFAQALALATEREKPAIRDMLKKYYLEQARAYQRVDRRNQAKKAYEKLITLDLTADERSSAQKELLGLYEKLGNIREFYKLKESM